MAGSRLERIGSIFSRTKGLIQSNALQWEDRPLWYDLYEAFPPKEEPRYDRAIPNVPIKTIFYEEDKIRALLHNRNKNIGMVNMFNHNSSTLTKRFIEAYRSLEKQHKDEVSEEDLYTETIELLQREKEQLHEAEEEQISLVSSFKEAQKVKTESIVAIKVSELFKP